jgi:hypothetical protein
MGSTPNRRPSTTSSLLASMKATICAARGRAPPRRTSLHAAGSRSLGAAPAAPAQDPSPAQTRSCSRPGRTPSSMAAGLTHERTDSTPVPRCSATRRTGPQRHPRLGLKQRTTRTGACFSSIEQRRVVGLPAVRSLAMNSVLDFPSPAVSNQPRRRGRHSGTISWLHHFCFGSATARSGSEAETPQLATKQERSPIAGRASACSSTASTAASRRCAWSPLRWRAVRRQDDKSDRGTPAADHSRRATREVGRRAPTALAFTR